MTASQKPVKLPIWNQESGSGEAQASDAETTVSEGSVPSHRTWTLVLGPYLRGNQLLPFPWHMPWISFGGSPIFANTKTMLNNICFRESPPSTATPVSSSSVAASTIPTASMLASATSLPSAAVAASSSSAPDMNTEDSVMCVSTLLFIIANNS